MTFRQTIKKRLNAAVTNKEQLLTRRVDQWISTHPEGIVLTPEVVDKITPLLLANENADRTGRFGASSIFSCQRQQIFKFLGMPMTYGYGAQLQNIFNDGTWRHLRWQAMGLMIPVFTDIEYEGRIPEFHRKVSLDAVNLDEGWGFELKGTQMFSQIVNDGPPRKHLGQMHICMAATGLEKMSYVAEDKRGQDWIEYVVHFDDVFWKDIQKEMEELAEAIDEEKLPRVLGSCVQRKGDDWRFCPFRESCLHQGRTWPSDRQWGSGAITTQVQAPLVRNRRDRLVR